MIKSQAELAQMLNGVYPTREYKWEGANNVADMPYIVYKPLPSNNFGADNIVYSKHRSYEINLYFPATNFEPEELLEQALDESGLFYETERAKASDFDLGEFADISLYDVSGGDFYITTYTISI